jgi:hypothetical protein
MIQLLVEAIEARSIDGGDAGGGREVDSRIGGCVGYDTRTRAFMKVNSVCLCAFE